MKQSTTASWIRTGVLALPVYGVLLAYTTRKPQPDSRTDPEGWARFVSSTSYLVEHVISTVLGTVLVILGSFALGALLARSRAPRLGLSGTVLAVVGYVLFTVPGVISTFATPAIGAAYLDGNPDVMNLEFSPVLSAIFGLGLLFAVVGNAVLSVAIWRSGILPKWSGLLWAVATLVFYVLGAALGRATTGASLPTQPIGAALVAISGAWMAWALFRGDVDALPAQPVVSTVSTPPDFPGSRPER